MKEGYIWIDNNNNNTIVKFNNTLLKYQPSGAGGTRSPPVTPHRLQHLTARLIQHCRRGMEIG